MPEHGPPLLPIPPDSGRGVRDFACRPGFFPIAISVAAR
jgi:hypothetical protein